MDRGDVVLHVQWFERSQSLEVSKQGAGYFGRRHVVGATVHDAMADGLQPALAKVVVGERQEGVQDRLERPGLHAGQLWSAMTVPAVSCATRCGDPSRLATSPRAVAFMSSLAAVSASKRANFRLDEPALRRRIEPAIEMASLFCW
jgi:hypothetical protein